MGTYRPRSTPPRFDRPQSPRSTQSRLETCRSTYPRPTTVELQKVWVIVIVIYKQNRARYSVWTHVIKVKRVKILIIILQDEVNYVSLIHVRCRIRPYPSLNQVELFLDYVDFLFRLSVFFLPFCISIYQQLSFCTVHQIYSHVESCHKQLYTSIKHNCIHRAMALIPFPQQLVKLQNCIISGMPSWGKWKRVIIIKRN